jgi:hypothetical protein
MSTGDLRAQLKSDDLLWAGVTLPVLCEDELARQQIASGDPVRLHRGVWWRQLKHSFSMPSYTYKQIDHEMAWPAHRDRVGGFMHLASPSSPSNGSYRAIVNDDVKRYSVQALSAKTRCHVRSGLAHLTVRPVEQQEDFTSQAHRVYVSWHNRTQWGRDKSEGARFDQWMSSVFQQTKRLILGAYLQDNLVAFMLPYAAGDTAFLAFAASHSEFLELHPNDALNHAFLTIARQTPGIETADFGPLCNKVSLNEFKLHYGRVKEFRSYTRLNPLLRPFVKGQLRRRYPWLGLDTQ